jgi:hypothetical protein
MFLDAPHKAGTRQATPNHLEAIFKSNKRKSMNQSLSQVLLEMNKV